MDPGGPGGTQGFSFFLEEQACVCGEGAQVLDFEEERGWGEGWLRGFAGEEDYY